MSDSWSTFWEKLIVGAVGVLVLAFLAQGMWFFLVELLVNVNPGFEAGLLRASSRLGVPWLVATAGALVWSGWRAWGSLEEIRVRR